MSERERRIHHDRESTQSKKSNKKKKAGKIRQFARCFMSLFIPTVFQFSY